MSTPCEAIVFHSGREAPQRTNRLSEASATLFPVGWSVKDRIGWTVAQLHRLVPTWEEKLSLSVERWDRVRTDQEIQG